MKTQKSYTFFTKIIFLWRCFHVDCGWCCCAFVSSGSALVNVLGLVLTSVQPRLWNIPLSPKVEACHLWLGKIECFNELWFTAWSKLVWQNTLEGFFFRNKSILKKIECHWVLWRLCLKIIPSLKSVAFSLSEASLDRRLAWLLFLAPFLEVPVCSIALVHLQHMMDLLQCVTAIILQL